MVRLEHRVKRSPFVALVAFSAGVPRRRVHAEGALFAVAHVAVADKARSRHASKLGSPRAAASSRGRLDGLLAEAIPPPPAGYEQVSFRATDGLRLHGWFRPSRNGATVLVVHGGNGDRAGSLAHAQMLARRGFGVLL